MKKLLFLMLLISTPLYAANRVTIQDGSGNELGTAANPVIVTNTGVGAFTNLTSTGDTTIGNAVTDDLTITAAILGASALVLDGATDNTNETTISVTDPSGDNTVTIPNASGTIPLLQASFSGTKMWVTTDAVASGQTSKAVTVTGITTSAKCFATPFENSTNSVYIRSAIPTANTCTVHTSGDPGASNLDIQVLCVE